MKLNSVQVKLYRLGYPWRIINEYKTGSRFFREELSCKDKSKTGGLYFAPKTWGERR